MSIIIRPAVRADAVGLPEIERDAGRRFLVLPDLAWIAGAAVMSAEDHLSAIEKSLTWVAEDETAGVVGFLTAEACPDAIHVWEMALRLEFQRRGAGSALLDSVAAHARTHALVAVTLTTFRDVAWNAPFYARCGYRILDRSALNERLVDVLRREADSGLPAERRCALARAV